MMIFNNFNSQRFTFNGIQYFKNYISKVAGNQISVFNAYDRKDVLVDWVHFGGVEVNGVTFGNVADLQSALLPVIYTRSSLGGGGGGGVESVSGNLVDNTDPNNPIVNGLADVIAGTNITIDKTDPANPIISSSGGGTSQQVSLQVLEVTLSDLGVSTMAEVNPTVVQAYISTLNTPLEVDKVFTVRVVEGVNITPITLTNNTTIGGSIEDFDNYFGGFSAILESSYEDGVYSFLYAPNTEVGNLFMTFQDGDFSDPSNLIVKYGNNAFSEANGDIVLGNCEFGDFAFNQSTVGSVVLNNCSFGDSAFLGFSTFESVTINNIISATNFGLAFIGVLNINGSIGGTVGLDNVFNFVLNDMIINVPLIMQTINGGNVEGDLQYAIDNNATVNFI